MTTEPDNADLRRPDPDETALSQAEVVQGLRDGTIPHGPLARRIAFTNVLVMQRVRVEDFYRKASR